MTIRGKIQDYSDGMADAHHRYRSWEHCYRYFRSKKSEEIATDREHAALQLGFYLASWGMYRGSSFLLQHAYTVHLGVIDQLVDPRFSALWEREFGASRGDLKLVPIINEAIDAVRDAFRPFTPSAESRQASDTLVTKIILGTIGCLPACDRFFIRGFRSAKLKYSRLDEDFVKRCLQFCVENTDELREQQVKIESASGMRYPLMKLVDMYFWQIGSEAGGSNEIV